MASDPCTSETTSLYLYDGVETAEIEHPCKHDDGHDGPHECMFCAVMWHAEATC